MRFMLLLKGDPAGEANPSEELIGAMMKFNEELVKAGVLLAAEGLHSSGSGARVTYLDGADGYIISAVERWTPLPYRHTGVGSMRRLQTIHYVEEHDPRMAKPILIEQRRDVDLGNGAREGWV